MYRLLSIVCAAVPVYLMWDPVIIVPCVSFVLWTFVSWLCTIVTNTNCHLYIHCILQMKCFRLSKRISWYLYMLYLKWCSLPYHPTSSCIPTAGAVRSTKSGRRSSKVPLSAMNRITWLDCWRSEGADLAWVQWAMSVQGSEAKVVCGTQPISVQSRKAKVAPTPPKIPVSLYFTNKVLYFVLTFYSDWKEQASLTQTLTQASTKRNPLWERMIFRHCVPQNQLLAQKSVP